MRIIQTESEYKVLCNRIVELMDAMDMDRWINQKKMDELSLISDLISDYEEKNHPLLPPTLIEVIKLRMSERGLNQKRLSEILGISTSRVSEYLTGKAEPTLKMAREISLKLNIDPAIVLGMD